MREILNLSEKEKISTNFRRKAGAVVLAVTGLFGASCSSEGSASSGGFSSPFSNSREVIAGDDCSGVEKIYSVGTYSSDGSNRYEPFHDGTLDPEWVALPDGDSRNNDTQGTLVDIGTFSDEQADQLRESYSKKVEQIDREKSSYGRTTYQDGFIVLYGKELADVSVSSSEDGIVDDKDLQVCVFAEFNQGDVSRDQFAK